MNSSKLKRMHALHSWAGLLSGWFVFVVCFSGTEALFGDELLTWQTPELRFGEAWHQHYADAQKAMQPPFDLHQRVDETWQSLQQQGDIRMFNLRLPTEMQPYFNLFANVKAEDQPAQQIEQFWHPVTGELLSDPGEGAAHWLVQFHRDLMIPNHTVGRTLVGVAGMLMLLMIVTGLLIHRKILADLFQWHLIKKSLKMRLRTSHNALAVWGVPFHIMIAFTGAFLGIVAILTPIVGVTAFKGDVESLQKLVTGEAVEAAEQAAPMMPIEQLLQQVQSKSGQRVYMLTLQHWKDANAEAEVYYEAPKQLMRGASAKVRLANGEMTYFYDTESLGVPTLITNAVTPLHYATYGGGWLKFLYVFLGLASSILVATGLALWIERRQNGPIGQGSPGFYERLARLNIGVMSGLVLASVMILYWDRGLVVEPEQRLYWNGVAFFTIWGLAVIFSQLPLARQRMNQILLVVSGVAMIWLPVWDLQFSEAGVSNLMSQQNWYVWASNWSAPVMGILLIGFLLRGAKTPVDQN